MFKNTEKQSLINLIKICLFLFFVFAFVFIFIVIFGSVLYFFKINIHFILLLNTQRYYIFVDSLQDILEALKLPDNLYCLFIY